MYFLCRNFQKFNDFLFLRSIYMLNVKPFRKLIHQLLLDIKRLRKLLIYNVKKSADFSTSEEELIIEIEYGGLGDHLFYSHLPRIAKETGRYKKVFLSDLSVIRNPKHIQLIWLLNPYLDGMINKPGKLFRHLDKKRVCDGKNILDNIMLAYGLDDGQRCHQPEVYYKPKRISKYIDQIFFDPNWVTKLYDKATVEKSVSDYFIANNIKIDFIFKPRNRFNLRNSKHVIIQDKSFEEFCDILYSCKNLYCFATGTAVLYEALGRSATVFCNSKMDPIFKFSNMHKYIDVQ